MPAITGLLEKIILYRLRLAPAQMLDIIGGFAFYAVSASVRTGIIDALQGKELGCGEIAEKTGCDERGVSILLELLESLGYVIQKNGKWGLSGTSRKWFSDSSKADFRPAFRYYHGTMRDLWPDLDVSLKLGRPARNFYDWLSDKKETAADFQVFMESLAAISVPEFVKKARLKKGELTLLDLGGGHGSYSIGLCLANPLMKAVIFDSPYSRERAEENISRAGLEERVSFRAGDYYSDDIGSGYGAVLVSNALHEHTPADGLRLVKKAAAALGPGGKMMILEGLREKSFSGLAGMAVKTYGLIFYHFLGGQNYTLAEIRSWMKESGIVKIGKKRLLRSGFSLVTGVKP